MSVNSEIRRIISERDELRAAINPDGSLTEHQQFIETARDGADALNKIAEAWESEGRERELSDQLAEALEKSKYGGLLFWETREAALAQHATMREK